MVARIVTLTEAKAKLSELLDAVERGEEIVIVRHGERVARLRAYSRTMNESEASGDPTLGEKFRRLREASAPDRAALRQAGISHSPEEWKRIAREGLA